MSAFTFVFPLLVIGAVAFYYFRIFQKGKAAGGGMMEGFAAQNRDRWSGGLQPGENIRHQGYGVLRRPDWQVMLAKNFPICSLIWPVVMWEMIVTSNGRFVMAKSGALGLKEFQSFDRSAVKFDAAAEEPQGSAFLRKMMGAGDSKTFSATLHTPAGQIPVSGVPATFLHEFIPGVGQVQGQVVYATSV